MRPAEKMYPGSHTSEALVRAKNATRSCTMNEFFRNFTNHHLPTSGDDAIAG
jgi:hypothetical protein